nr:hypothetical protein [Methanophagales archaeon]
MLVYDVTADLTPYGTNKACSSHEPPCRVVYDCRAWFSSVVYEHPNEPERIIYHQ